MTKDELLIYVRRKLILENIRDTTQLYREAESDGINPSEVEELLIDFYYNDLMDLSPIKDSATSNRIIDVHVHKFESMYRDQTDTDETY
ncbi:hypothetical protein [Shouchella patagoniensis]|uniref:hypothetical protein n=1 Tax=Shouchella patagoniensis TaxID=228576 RepID=UPI00099522B0|nr:hypothetical protein [Shouchella patagoniensis]